MRSAPTPAWVRATVLVVACVALGVLRGRVDLVLLVVPLAVWVVWAFVARPPDVLTLTTTPGRRVVGPEDVRLALGVAHDGAGPLVVATAWRDLPGAHFEPVLACATDVVGAGEPCTVVVEPRRWGNLEVGPATVALTHPSGAWRAVGTSSIVDLSLRPAIGTLRGPTGVARPIGVAGLHTSSRRGDGSALADIRPFQTGDRLRRINWRVASRKGALHVNSTLVERDTEVLVVTDSTQDTLGPDPDGSTPLDLGVRATVAIARYYVGLGDRVQVSDLGPWIRSVRPGTGLKQARLITEVLSRAPRGQNGRGLRSRIARLTPGTLVFVCSPLLQEEVVAEVVRLRRLGGEVVVVDTLPEAMGEQALRWQRRDSSSAEAWYLNWIERQRWVDSLRASGVPVTPWRGPTSLGGVLLALEAARAAPRRAVGR